MGGGTQVVLFLSHRPVWRGSARCTVRWENRGINAGSASWLMSHLTEFTMVNGWLLQDALQNSVCEENTGSAVIIV